MIRRTHNLLQWLLAIFIVYLLVTRLIISWIQFFPTQFAYTVESVSGIQVQFENVEMTQSWLGFDMNLKNVKAKSEEFEFQAEVLKFDLNLFYFLFPTLDYGDVFVLENGALQYLNSVSQTTPNSRFSARSEFDLNELHKYNPNIDRLWKKVHLQNFVISELAPKLTVQISELQSLKKYNLNVVTEFSLSYADVLDYEPFNLRATLQPNIWGTIDSGDAALSSFKPLKIQKIKGLLPASWSTILPNGEFILDIKTQIADAKISTSQINLYAQSLDWKQGYQDLPKNVGLQFDWLRKAESSDDQLFNWQFSLSSIQIDNNYIDSISPIELYFEGREDVYFKSERFDLEPFEVVIKALMETQLAANVLERAVYLSLKDVDGRFNWKTLQLKDINMHIERLDLPLTDFPGMSIRGLQINKDPSKLTIAVQQPVWILEPTINPKPMKLDLPEIMAFGFDPVNHAWTLPKVELKLNQVPIQVFISQINADYLDTDFKVNFASMSQLKSYLPYSLMSEKLHKWLKSALQGGENITVDGRIRGLFSSFPFTDNNGVLELDAKVENARLKFNSQWPELSGFDANIEFKPYQINILTNDVRLNQDLVATDVKVEIPNVDRRDIKLSFSGKVSSELTQAINYLQVSPIAEKVGLNAFFDSGAEFAGNIDVVLDEVLVPISGFENVDESVRGRFRLDKAGLKISNELDFTQINGDFIFDENRLDATQVTFNGFAGSGLLDLETQLDKKQILLKLTGNALSEKNSWTKSPLPWSGLIQIPFKSSPKNDITVLATAKLSEAQSLVPYPFDQVSLKDKLFKINAQINQYGGALNYSIAKMLNGSITLSKNRNKLAVVSSKTIFGSKSLEFYKAPSNASYIRGDINKIELDPWLAFLSSLELNNLMDVEANQRPLQWIDSSLNIGKVNYLANDFSEMKLKLNFYDKSSNIRFEGPDAAGMVQIQNDKVEVQVDKLALITEPQVSNPNNISKKQDQKVDCPAVAVEDTALNLFFNGKNITLDGKKIDRLRFSLIDTAVLKDFKDIQADFGSGTASLKADIKINKLANKTRFSGELSSKKVFEVARLLDIEKGLTGKKANINLNFEWDGGVDCFALKDISGNIRFKLREGSIEEVDPGVARLIGLLSIESLVRRLKLDLKDVTNKGLVYDRIDGYGDIKNGELSLSELKMQAPSANMTMSGKLDLINEKFNLKANVTPKVGATIPTIAALAGSTNPLAALAVYTIMKIIPDVNENLITYEYEIDGPWKEPVIKAKNAEVLTSPSNNKNSDFDEGGLLFED